MPLGLLKQQTVLRLRHYFSLRHALAYSLFYNLIFAKSYQLPFGVLGFWRLVDGWLMID